MVQVYFEEKNGRLRIDINGHASIKNMEGLDVLCACCTTLANTLAVNLLTYKELGAIQGEPVVYLGENGEGKARLSCRPTAMAYTVVKAVYSGIAVGFELLSRLYPDEVQYVHEPNE